MQVAASRLRARKIGDPADNFTVGRILDAEALGASRYPNEIRYGPLLRHFSPSAVSAMSGEVIRFAKEHWSILGNKTHVE
jgi:hypothetical protein